MATGRIDYALSVDTKTGQVSVRKFNKTFKGLGSAAEQACKQGAAGLTGLGMKITGINQSLEIAKKAFFLLRGPIMEVVNTSADFEALRTRLDATFQSASKGKAYFEWVKNFAATTPFQFGELTNTTIMLENFGISAKTHLQTIGDASAVSGQQIGDLGRIMGQIYSKPNAQMEEMLQLTERGIPVMKILQQELGLTAQQASEVGKAGVSGVQAFNAIMEGMKKRYQGGMKKLSAGWHGLVSTAKDLWKQFMAEIGQSGLLSDLKKKLTDVIQKINDWVADGTLKHYASEISNVMSVAVDLVIKGIRFLVDNREVIYGIATVMATMWAVQKINMWATAISGGLTMLSNGVRLFSVYQMAGMSSFGAIKASILSTTAGMGGLQAATVKATAALAAAYLVGKGLAALADLWIKKSDEKLAKTLAEQKELEKTYKFVQESYAIDKKFGNEVRSYIKDLVNSGISRTAAAEQARKVFSARLGVLKKTKVEEKAYGAATLQVQKYVDKHNVSVAKATEIVNKHNNSIKKAAEQNRTFALSLDLIPDMKKLSEETQKIVGAFKAYGDRIFDNDEKTAAFAKKVEALTDQYLKHGKDVPQALQAINTEINNSAWGWKELEKSLPKPRKFDFLNMVPKTAPLATGSVSSLDSVMKDLNSDLEKNWKEMTSSSESAQELNASLELLDKSLNLLSGAFSSLGIDASGVIGVFGNLSKGVQTFSTASAFDVSCMFESFGDGLGGFLENFSAGLSSISAYAAGATAVIGGLVKGIKALFGGHDWSKWVNNLNRAKIPLGEFKDDIEKLAKELRKSAKSTQDAAEQAYNTYLAQVIREADVKTENFRQYADSVYNMLYQVDNALNYKSSASITTTLTQMGDAFSALAEKQKVSNNYSKRMKDIMYELKQRGLEVAEVEQYRLEKNQAGYEAYKQLYDTTALDEMIAKQKELQNSIAGMNAGSSEYTKAHEELMQLGLDIAENTKYQEIFANTTYDVYAQMAKEEKQLAAQQDLVDKLKSWTDLITNFSDVHDVSQDKFTAWQSTAAKSFEALTSGGMDSNIALKQLAPSLTRLIELSNTHGFVIDENTQAMIDQAREAGISLEKQIDPQERMVDILEKIAIRFGCDIPEAMNDMADSAEASFMRTRGGLTMLEGGATQLGETFRSSLNGLQEKVRNLGSDLGITVGSSNNGTRDVINLPRKIPGFATGTGGMWVNQPGLISFAEREPEYLEWSGSRFRATPLSQTDAITPEQRTEPRTVAVKIEDNRTIVVQGQVGSGIDMDNILFKLKQALKNDTEDFKTCVVNTVVEAIS